MLVKGKDIIGLSIVTIDTGTVIETIKDVAYNPTSQRIEALFVKKGGIFSSAKAIHIDDVENIGEDAAIVADVTVVKSVKQLPEVVAAISGSKKYLVNTKVLTIEGKALGRVSDILFDSKTGYVDSMEVSQGGIKTLTEGKKTIKPIDIVTIGADTTIVSTYTEQKLEAQGEQGGLKGAVNDAKDKAVELGLNAKEASQDVAERAATVTRDLSDKASDAYDDIRHETAKQAKQAKRNIRELADRTAESIEDVKDNTSSQIDSLRREGSKVVSKSQKTLEDATEQVEIEKTRIVRKK